MKKDYGEKWHPPGKVDEIYCEVCLTKCSVTRNWNLYTNVWIGKGLGKVTVDRFSCPHSHEPWHNDAIALIKEHGQTNSKRLKELIKLDINDVLEEGLGDVVFWREMKREMIG
jgi:hypothetical protein